MGYMGFGMRKEVYTRKPKQAYEKLKGVLGSNAKYANREGTREDVAPHRWNALRERRALIIKVGIVFGLLVSTLLWQPIVDWRFKRQRMNYETERLPSILKSHNSAQLSALRFLAERSDRIYLIDHDYPFMGYNDQIILFDEDATTDSLETVVFRWKGSVGEVKHLDEILPTNQLVVHRNNSTDTIDGNWAYYMNDVPPNRISESFLEYMKTDSSELKQLMNSKSEFWVQRKEDGSESQYESPKYGYYRIHYSAKEPRDTTIVLSDGSMRHIYSGRIDTLLYWERTETEK